MQTAAIRLACMAAATSGLAVALAGCAGVPDTRTMGAAPACDLRVELRQASWCAVQRVEPRDAERELTESMRNLEDITGP